MRIGYTPLMCKDCPTEIFADVNMVMLKDKLWKQISDDVKDALCDCCIKKRMGREITPKDFKPSSFGDMIPCNAWWLQEQKNKCAVCGSTEKYSEPETGGWKTCRNCGTI